MRPFFTLALLSPLFLAGCAADFNSHLPEANVGSAALQGSAFGGQQPLTNATVTVYTVGSSGYGAGATAQASTTTDANGNFGFAANAYTCPYSNTPTYITVTGGNGGYGAASNTSSAMISSLGQCSAAHTAFVVVNELTTAATVVSVAQFMGTAVGASGTAAVIGGTCTGCAGGTYNQGLVAAFNTIPKLVSTYTGQVAGNTTSNGLTILVEQAKLHTLADVLAACVNSSGATSTTETTTICGQLFNYTKTSSTTRPSDTLQAMLQIALHPGVNVVPIYNLIAATPPFGSLSSAPNDWTVGLGYVFSYLPGLAIAPGTSSNIDIDASGKIWFPQSFPQNGSPEAVLANFDPSTGIFSAGTETPGSFQYVAIDTNTTPYIWTTNLANNTILGESTSSVTTQATVLTATGATAGGPVIIDGVNNILAAEYTGSAYQVFATPAARTAPAVAYGGLNLTGTPTGFSYTGIGAYTTTTYSSTQNVLFSSYNSGKTCGGQEIQIGSGASAGDTTITTHPVTTTTDSGNCLSGGVNTANNSYFADATDNKIGNAGASYGSTYGFSAPQGINADGALNAWIANAGNASIQSVTQTLVSSPCCTVTNTPNPVAYMHGSGNGGTMVAPYGIAVDGSGNVWVSNAGCINTSSTSNCAPGNFVLSEVIGVAKPATTPNATVTRAEFVNPGNAIPTK